MKLYYHPLSSYSRKVMIAMAEKQLSFEPEIVNLFDPEAKAAYKRDVNPFGKVPVLKLENPDWMIPESSIIIEYLDGHYDSGTRLIPEDKDLARQARFSDRISDQYLLDPTVYVMLQTLFVPEDQRNQAEIEVKSAKVRETLGLLNEHIGNKTFLLNAQFSMADISASVACQIVRDVLQFPLNDWPNVEAWLNRCLSRDSWQKVQQAAAPYWAKVGR
ncbi:MAG: glutathione S-transferase family protein [Candidatus Sericytochromatia bacterium]